jgi:hypothetical protein
MPGMFKHIHIVACSPRSGTTLLHEVMVTCFKVDKHYDHEVRFHLISAKDGQILITKRPKDTMYMPAVIDGDPGLYVIYLMRDPRDTICSRHGKDKSIYYSNIRLWRQMHAYARKMSGHERFLEIRYEDFVRDPDATQQVIMDKFPWLEKIHDFSEYHEYAQVSEKSLTAMHSVRPIAPTSVGVWMKNPGRIRAQQMIHGSLTPELIECGYESSADWESVLADAEPDFTRSLYPEKLYFWSRISQYLNGLRKIAKYRRLRRVSQ